jgi:hypothetical protein
MGHITDLNESERSWVRGNLELAGTIAKAYRLLVEPGDGLESRRAVRPMVPTGFVQSQLTRQGCQE